MELPTELNSLVLSSLENTQQANALQRAETAKTAAFELEMRKLVAQRSEKNVLRKQMDDIISDIMNVLKKSGEEVRKSN